MSPHRRRRRGGISDIAAQFRAAREFINITLSF